MTDDAQARGRDVERARVVAWLRSYGSVGHRALADDVERAEHWKGHTCTSEHCDGTDAPGNRAEETT